MLGDVARGIADEDKPIVAVQTRSDVWNAMREIHGTASGNWPEYLYHTLCDPCSTALEFGLLASRRAMSERDRVFARDQRNAKRTMVEEVKRAPRRF